MKKISLRESLIKIDKETDFEHNLTAMYESCSLTEDEKEKLVKYVDAYDIDSMNKMLNNKFTSDITTSEDAAMMESYFEDGDISDDELASILGGDTKYDIPDGIETPEETKARLKAIALGTAAASGFGAAIGDKVGSKLLGEEDELEEAINDDDKPTVLSCRFEVYTRYGNGGIRKVRVRGKNLQAALTSLVGKLNLYILPESIEEEPELYTPEYIINSIEESNGDGCDFIFELKNETTGETYISEEEDWEEYDEYDESINEKWEPTFSDEWKPEDIELWKSIDWKARNYAPYIDETKKIRGEVTAVGLPGGIRTGEAMFAKEFSANPIFTPKWKPITDPFEGQGTNGWYMYDGVDADDGYMMMTRTETQEVSDMLSEALDDALKDRSILGHCDTQVRERVYAQLDKYIPLSKESPMYKEVNKSYSDLNKGDWVEYNLSVRKGTENIIPVKVDTDLGSEFYGWAWGEGYHKYQKSRIIDKIDMDDTDEIIRKYSLNEASYGGAFDIEDNQYFTRDDIEDAAEYVIDHINETFDDRFVLGGTWFENNTWTVNVQTEDGMEEYEKSIHIDMRKIKAPRDLKDKFNIDMAAKLIKDIKELKYDIHEDFEDDITETFIADGEEYEWIDKRITRHDTRDSQGFAEEWFIASAKSLEDGETYYFIIDDNDFIDWGPCYTLDEAQEFLISKDSDYDDMYESLKESITSDAKPIEDGPKVGMASIISDLIKDEYEAIDGYNAAIATAQAEGFEDAIKVLTEIQAEENIHIGQLQEVMKLFDPNAAKVEDGQAEGAEQLANPIATDIDEELETEDSVFNKFVEIEKDLNDGEAVTAVIDKMVADNKDNPKYEKAYQRWLNK